MSPRRDPDDRRPPERATDDAGPGLAVRALHVFTLTGFAVAQPVLDLLGRHATFFVAHDSLPLDLVALAAVLCLGLPALLFLAELIPGLVAARAGRSMHSVLVTFLAAAIAIQVLRRVEGVPGWIWLGAALLLGVAAAALYDRSAVARTYLTWLSPAPLVFAAVFLFFTPVNALVFPEPYVSQVDAPVDSETPVVMVVFDELALPTLLDPAGEVDAGRYPHYAEVAATSTWFRNATTSAEFTPVAIPSMVTGRFLSDAPGSPYIANVERHPQSLFTLLAPEYRLHVSETMTNLCPRELCGPAVLDGEPLRRIRYLLDDIAIVYPHSVLPKDVLNELPDVTNQWRGFGNPWRVRREKIAYLEGGRRAKFFTDFLETLRGGERRALYFLHTSLPHAPWRYLPSGKSYAYPGSGMMFTIGLSQETWDHNELSVEQAFQRYLLQLRFTDRLLGDLLATLREAGLYDDALLVVTADHGVSFRSGQRRRHVTAATLPDILPVPLFVKLPHQREGRVSDRNVELIDILPTITDVLGLAEPPWPTDGVSLLDENAPERPVKTVYRPPYEADDFETYDPAALEARYRAAERMHRLFGHGPDPLDLYRIGPHPELVGRPLAELDVAAEPAGVLHLAEPRVYDAVDPEADFVPARVIGEIRGHGVERGALPLAVAVNGTVWAVTRTFQNHSDRARFAAMVPESAFVPGRNRIEVFLLSGDGEAPRLAPTRAAPRRSRFF